MKAATGKEPDYKELYEELVCQARQVVDAAQTELFNHHTPLADAMYGLGNALPKKKLQTDKAKS